VNDKTKPVGGKKQGRSVSGSIFSLHSSSTAATINLCAFVELAAAKLNSSVVASPRPEDFQR
jgi:hypothetical protein